MRLTRAQRHLLDDGTGSQRKAMQMLLAVGRRADAPRLMPITSAHVSGVWYKLIGYPGLEFLEDFARDARVSVPTTVNPLGTDLAQWQALGVPPSFAEKQGRIASAYEAMGVRRSFSCTPYLIGVRPTFGEHVAWAESSAVCFANSVLGARTNREGGPAALAAAIVGATPEHELHTDEGREPTAIVKVGEKSRGASTARRLGSRSGSPRVGSCARRIRMASGPSSATAVASSRTHASRSRCSSTDSARSRRPRGKGRTICQAYPGRRSSSRN